MNPNYPYYQQQPGYGAAPPNYGGMLPNPQTPRPGMMPGPHTPMSGSMPGPHTPVPGVMSAPYTPVPGAMSAPRTPVPGMTGPPTQGLGMMTAPRTPVPGMMPAPPSQGHRMMPPSAQGPGMIPPPTQGHGIMPPPTQGSGMMPPPTQGMPPQQQQFPNQFIRSPQPPSNLAHQMGGLSMKDTQTPGMMPPRGPAPPNQQQMGISQQYQNGNTERPYMPQQFPNQYNSSPLPPSMNQGPPQMAGMKDGLMPPNQQQMGMSPQYRNGNSNPGDMGGHYPSYPPGMGAAPPQPMPQQQARRLDPDQMPSAIQVMEDDKKTRTGDFITSTKGLVPPLVTTPFVTRDQGNTGPRFIRSSMYSVPSLPDMMKQTAVPFSLVISPFADVEEGEHPPPIVDMGETGPVRCGRCKAYMCSFMQFVEGGRKFHCPFCKATTELPPEYFVHLDHTGVRLDKYQRPELWLGSYEFVGTKEYCRNNTFPKPPAFVFVIDVSYNNVKSGLVHLLCQNMKNILKHLPREVGAERSVVRVGFITYSNEVHFYNIKSTLAQPQMMVVGDVQDMFMPLLDGFLADPTESESVIDQLMIQIPTMFAESRETETILGPAVQAGVEALKAAECAGKILLFNSSLPVAEAPGKLKNRDDRKLLGTDKEKVVLAPQTTFYNQLGQDCIIAGCSVDLFACHNAFIDLGTIGQACRISGGQVYKYTYFQSDVDGQRLIEDVKRSVERTVAFDTIMRVRTSTGVRPVDFYGHFFMSNTTDVEVAAFDTDSAVTIEIKHDDKLTDEDGVYIQAAVLFTSPGGQRRLRIHNLSLSVCTQMADLYRSCDLDTIMNFLMKQSITKSTEIVPKQIRDSLINRGAQILACYRKNCASPSSPGQLILPECMKLLPLYINCLLNCDALSGGPDMTIDDRTFNMYYAQTSHVAASLGYLYPRLIPLMEMGSPTSPDNILPMPIRCTYDKLRDDGAYVLDNGIHLFLWIGHKVIPEWIQGVLGKDAAAQVDINRMQLQEYDNPYSQQVRGAIAQLRNTRQRFMRLTIVRPRDKLEFVFRKFLAEDKHSDSSSSYVDFLCHLHKEIRALLN